MVTLTLTAPVVKKGTAGHRVGEFILEGAAAETYPAGGIPLGALLAQQGFKRITGQTVFRVTCENLNFMGAICLLARIDHSTPSNPLLRLYSAVTAASPLTCTEMSTGDLIQDLEIDIVAWE